MYIQQALGNVIAVDVKECDFKSIQFDINPDVGDIWCIAVVIARNQDGAQK